MIRYLSDAALRALAEATVDLCAILQAELHRRAVLRFENLKPGDLLKEKPS